MYFSINAGKIYDNETKKEWEIRYVKCHAISQKYPGMLCIWCIQTNRPIIARHVIHFAYYYWSRNTPDTQNTNLNSAVVNILVVLSRNSRQNPHTNPIVLRDILYEQSLNANFAKIQLKKLPLRTHLKREKPTCKKYTDWEKRSV